MYLYFVSISNSYVTMDMKFDHQITPKTEGISYTYCIRSVEFHASVQCKQSTKIEDIHSQKTNIVWIQMIRHFDFPKFLPGMFIANY